MALTDQDKQWIEQTLDTKLEEKLETKLTSKLAETEERIVTRINREVTDLAEVNRLALAKLHEHDQQLAALKHAHGH